MQVELAYLETFGALCLQKDNANIENSLNHESSMKSL